MKVMISCTDVGDFLRTLYCAKFLSMNDLKMGELALIILAKMQKKFLTLFRPSLQSHQLNRTTPLYHTNKTIILVHYTNSIDSL
jgi:hypothetical protein